MLNIRRNVQSSGNGWLSPGTMTDLLFSTRNTQESKRTAETTASINPWTSVSVLVVVVGGVSAQAPSSPLASSRWEVNVSGVFMGVCATKLSPFWLRVSPGGRLKSLFIRVCQRLFELGELLLDQAGIGVRFYRLLLVFHRVGIIFFGEVAAS